MPKQGMRGSEDYGNQRPGAFGKGIKLQGRITRDEVANRLKKVKYPYRPSGAKRK